MKGIDFTPELARRASRTGSLGRVSPNTRLRSRKNSKVISSTDVIASNDVISTSAVMNNDVISNIGEISTNDVMEGDKVVVS